MSDSSPADLDAFTGLRGSAEPVDSEPVTPAEETPAEVQAAPQETPEPAATEVTPTEPEPQPAVTPAVDHTAAFEALLSRDDLNDEAKNLVNKYRAGGKSPADALVEALKVSGPAYWNWTKAEAEKARAAKEAAERPAEVVSPTPAPAEPAAPPATPAEVQAIDVRVGQLQDEFRKVDEGEQASRAALQTALDRISAASLKLALGASDLDAEDKLKAEIKEAADLRQRAERYIAYATNRKQQMEDSYAALTQLRETKLAVLELRRAREAEANEKAKAAEAARADAERARKGTLIDTFHSQKLVVAREGNAIADDLLEDFYDAAEIHLARTVDLNTATPAEITAALREARKQYDAKVDKHHRFMSRIHAQQKDKDVAVNAPTGAAAVAPAVKRTGLFRDVDDPFTGLQSAR